MKEIILLQWVKCLSFHNKTLLCSPQSPWLQLPNLYLPVKAFWQARLGMVAWSSAVFAPRTISGCAALPCVFMWNLATSSVWRKHVRLWNVSHCMSLWSPWTKRALFLWLVAGAAADVSGATAMKHPNRVPERKESSTELRLKGGLVQLNELSCVSWTACACAQKVSPRQVKRPLWHSGSTQLSVCLAGDQEVAVFLCHSAFPAAASSFPALSDRRAFWLHRNILFIITSKNIMTGD